MNVLFLLPKEEKKQSIAKSLLAQLKNFFKKPTLPKSEEDFVYLIDEKNLKNQKKRKNLFAKINQMAQKEEIKKIAIADKILSIPEINLEIQENNLAVLEPKQLLDYLVLEIIEYICKQQDKSILEIEVTLLVNKVNTLNLKIIEKIAKTVKGILIVSESILQFSKIEEELSQEYGIAIRVSNNKRKSLAKSKLIINLDFSEEKLNQYHIYYQAILININTNIYHLPKQFAGININQVSILVQEELKQDWKRRNLMPFFNTSVLYLSNLEAKDYETIKKQLEEDNVRITNVIGLNGVIQNWEFRKIG